MANTRTEDQDSVAGSDPVQVPPESPVRGSQRRYSLHEPKSHESHSESEGSASSTSINLGIDLESSRQMSQSISQGSFMMPRQSVHQRRNSRGGFMRRKSSKERGISQNRHRRRRSTDEAIAEATVEDLPVQAIESSSGDDNMNRSDEDQSEQEDERTALLKPEIEGHPEQKAPSRSLSKRESRKAKHKSRRAKGTRSFDRTTSMYTAQPSFSGKGSRPAGSRSNSERLRARTGDTVIDMEDSDAQPIPEERESHSEHWGNAELTAEENNRDHNTVEDDVCFPLNDFDRSEGTEDGIPGSRADPDFSVLDEWAETEAKEQLEGSGNAAGQRHQELDEPVQINGRYRSRGGWTTSKKEAERPYRFTFFAEDLPSTVHSPTLFELTQEDQSFKQMFKGVRTWWLDVKDPTDTEMKVLSRTFGIHPLTTEDISTEEVREKVELFRHYYLVSFRSFEQEEQGFNEFEPQSIYIVVFRDGVMTFHFGTTPHCANVRRRIRQLRDYITVSPDWISYALIDDITDTFQPVINGIEKEVDQIDAVVLGIDEDDSVFKGDNQSLMLRRIGECRKQVMSMLRLLGTKADVVRGFAKRCNEKWDVAPRSEIGLYLGDIQDHIVTMVQNLNHYEKILSRSHSNYLAKISIEMTRVNNDTNDVVSRLSILGTIIFPMNIVTGLWGMNVPVPGQDSSGLAWFFSILASLSVFAVLSVVLCRWFRII